MTREEKIISKISKVIITPYNWSLILLTGLIFYIFYETPYANHSYDRASNWFNYMILFSGGALIARYLKENGRAEKNHIGAYGLVSFILSLVTLLLLKSLQLGLVITYITLYSLLPISIFIFLLLVKNIFLDIDKN